MKPETSARDGSQAALQEKLAQASERSERSSGAKVLGIYVRVTMRDIL